MARQSSFEEKVYEYIKKYHLLEEGSSVIIGLSGGADSIALLRVLKHLSSPLSLKLTAVHVHHGIRGKEADEDAAYVQGLCRDWDIPCIIIHGDIPALAEKNHESLEEAGRNFRYHVFEEVRVREEAAYIAVAHHRDDQAETVLMNLFRGSSLRGLSGMQPVRDRVIRPLLSVSKAEILTYLQEEEIFWREDATNQVQDYTRNKLRLDIIPAIEREINIAAADHIVKTAELLGEVTAYIDRQVSEVLPKLLIRDQRSETPKIVLDGDLLLLQDPMIQKEVVRQAMIMAAGSAKDITYRHLEQILDLAASGHDGQSHLPYGLVARKQGKHLLIARTEKSKERLSVVKKNRRGRSCDSSEDRHERAGRENGRDVRELIPGDLALRLSAGDISIDHGLQLSATDISLGSDLLGGSEDYDAEKNGRSYLMTARKEPATEPFFDSEKGLVIPKKLCTKWVDYDKINNRLLWRTRREGDYMLIAGGHRKSLKRLLIDMKVPAEDRSQLYFLADGDHVVWIPKLNRMSEAYKITETTRSILRIEIKENKNEREN